MITHIRFFLKKHKTFLLRNSQVITFRDTTKSRNKNHTNLASHRQMATDEEWAGEGPAGLNHRALDKSLSGRLAGVLPSFASCCKYY